MSSGVSDLFNNAMPSSPCNKCAFRTVGCHSNCIKYIDYKQRMAVERKRYDEKKRSDDVYAGYKKWHKPIRKYKDNEIMP